MEEKNINQFIQYSNNYKKLKGNGILMLINLLSHLEASPFNNFLFVKEKEIEKDACICFSFLGQQFIVQIETYFENKAIVNGKLCTYLQSNDEISKAENELLYEVKFDTVGNIGDGYLLDDFAINYLVNSLISFVNVSNEEEEKNKLIIKPE